MNHKPKNNGQPGNKVIVVLPATVAKIIPAVTPTIGHSRPEMMEIAVEGAEALYQEIRVDNMLHDEAGNAVSLKLGAEVEVTIEAHSDMTLPHKDKVPKGLARPTHAANKKKTS